jgi:hypothetical protein
VITKKGATVRSATGSRSAAIERAAWRNDCEHATPGPWGYLTYGGDATGAWIRVFTSYDAEVFSSCGLGRWECIRGRVADAQFIKTARNALPRLLDEVEALEATNQRLQDELDRMRATARGAVAGVIVVPSP